MAVCGTCGQFIVFGGVKEAGERYCNAGCAAASAARMNVEVPEAVLEKQVRAIHQANCPKCQGPGPVDLHTSHRVFSALVFTRWSSHPELCCRSCAVKKRLGDAVFSLVLGWWGIPWGLIMTPIQISRNLGGVFRGPDPATPSPEMAAAIRRAIVDQFLAAQAAAGPRTGGK